MSNTYILEGTIPVPVDLCTWAQWYETANRHVADTWVTPNVRVSTVFLGLDHQGGDGPPVLFETMIVGGDIAGQDQWRHGSWHEAEQGHETVVAAVRAALVETQP